jgi:signal transduction histidine kinase
MKDIAAAPTSSKSNPRRGVMLAMRVVWAAVFALLLALVVASLAGGDLLQRIGDEWLVGRGLPAARAFVPGDAFYLYLVVLRYAALAVYWLVALLIFWRRSDDWVALLVSWVLLLVPFSLIPGEEDGSLETQLTFLGMTLFLLLFYLFPDGRFIPLSRRGRVLLAAALLVTPFLSFAGVSLLQSELAAGERAYGAFSLTWGTAMICGVASQIYRFRSVSNAVERQQTRWVLFGLGAQLIWILPILLFILPAEIVGEGVRALITLHINVLVPLLIPLSFGVAMLRSGLWEVGPLLNRTLVYGALTAAVVALYVLIVGALGAFFQARGSLIVALLATGTVAVLFQPLRSWLQKAVNRLMYGERDDPYGVLTRLSEELEQADAAEAMLPALVETVAVALKLPYVAIWLEREGWEGWEAAASVGERPEHVESIPLRHEGQEIGRLDVAPRAPGEQLAEADRLLLTNIARLVTTTARTLQLNEQLQESRRQLVTAREEERRRIRRDLHDGLGPALASITLQADTSVDLVYSNPDEAVSILKKMRELAQTAVSDIRLLVQGLRPPALDELGLAGAIRQHMAGLERSDLAISVESPERLPPLPAGVEVAAYRIAMEAISNVARHAGATSCTVRLAVDGELLLEIIDDGAGLPENGSIGIGLRSMSERAAELGGSCLAERLPGGGTRVLARLPLNESGQKA